MDFAAKAEENRILEVRVGSGLFGTSTPDSDLDVFGVFLPWDELVFGFQRCEEVDLSIEAKDDTGRNTKDAVDRKLHEYRKFVRLLLQNNPNILHVIMADEKNILFRDEHGFADRLFEMGPKFIHKGAYHRFVKYAQSQQHKMMIKPQNYHDLVNGLGFLQLVDEDRVIAEAVAISGDTDSNPFRDCGHGKHVQCGDLSFERGVFVKKAKRMIHERLSKASNRNVLYTKYGYDCKFGSNLIQLLKEGIELMRTGWIQMPLAYAQDILDVKNGKYSADDIAEWSEHLVHEAAMAFERTELPTNPPAIEIERFVIREVRRWLELNAPADWRV